MALTPPGDDVLAWMRSRPRPDGYTLDELSKQFGTRRERMRDQLRRLVDAGLLDQSEPISGFADANPIYTLADAPA